jgi:hypothetical protein
VNSTLNWHFIFMQCIASHGTVNSFKTVSWHCCY